MLRLGTIAGMFNRQSNWKQQAQHFRKLPRRSLLTFLTGVLCLFAAMGVVTDLMSLESSTPARLVYNILFSGLFAIGWAYLGTMRMVRTMAVLGVCQFGVAFVYGRLFPPSRHALTPQQFHNAIALRGLLLTLLIIAGYSLFIGFFRMEGRRFFAVQTEIDLASAIHRSLVPPIDTSVRGVEIYGLSLPSGAVGGDLLDVVQHPTTCLAYVADVSGHGVKAGVLMSMLKSSVRTRFLTAAPAAEGFLDDLNQVLHPLMDGASYATMSFVLFEPDGGVRFSLAAHAPILHWKCRDRRIHRHGIENLPVAMFADTRYRTGVIDIETGDILAIVTDGLTEIFNRRNEELGTGYIERLLAENAGGPLHEIAGKILKESERFGPITDDRTLLLIRTAPSSPVPV